MASLHPLSSIKSTDVPFLKKFRGKIFAGNQLKVTLYCSYGWRLSMNYSTNAWYYCFDRIHTVVRAPLPQVTNGK